MSARNPIEPSGVRAFYANATAPQHCRTARAGTRSYWLMGGWSRLWRAIGSYRKIDAVTPGTIVSVDTHGYGHLNGCWGRRDSRIAPLSALRLIAKINLLARHLYADDIENLRHWAPSMNGAAIAAKRPSARYWTTCAG